MANILPFGQKGVNDLVLYEAYMGYNPEKDPSGNYGKWICDLVLGRCGGTEKLEKWLMNQKISHLELESRMQQNN